MASRLPLLVSVPHGGDVVPAELAEKLVLSRHDVFWDSDACTRDIYGASDLVEHYIDTPIARAVVDLNRAADDRPPANPDGVVKQTTCLGVPLYAGGEAPSDADSEALIARYYRPYHEQLRTLLDDGKARLALDCHSMLARGPELSPDRGQERPLICLGNRGNRTCSEALLEAVRNLFIQAFGLEPDQVKLNAPFSGGYITRTYGNAPIPWLQVEMSRALYLEEPWFDPETLEVDGARLRHLNQCFREVLRGVAASLVGSAP